MDKVNTQRKLDGLHFDMPLDAVLTKLHSSQQMATLPQDYPIYSTTRSEWSGLSEAQQQKVIRDKWAVVISGDSDSSGEFGARTLKRFGDLDQVRVMHGKLKDITLPIHILTG